MKPPFGVLSGVLLFLPLCVSVTLFAADVTPAKVSSQGNHSRACASPEAAISAEDILHRCLEARGGERAAAKIGSFRATGTTDFSGGGRCRYEHIATRSSQERTIFEFGGDARYEFCVDGESAWEKRPGKAAERMFGEKLRENLDDAAFFASYHEPGTFRLASYVGLVSFEGVKCHELKLITHSGLEQTHYYNATNYLLFAVVERVTTDAGPISATTIFLEYGKFHGFLFPTRLRCRTDESEFVIRVNSVRVGGVESSEFRMPEEPKAVASGERLEAPALSDVQIKTILQDCVEVDKVAVGLAVGLVNSNGSRVISYGKLDNGSTREVDGDTLFEIGSITKLFTHLLLHDMVARGEMAMDDPVQKYLPASVRMPARHGKQITLWDLTTHTSGLPRDMGSPRNIDHLYAFLAAHKLRRDPGEQFEYSNLGVALLGHVIALKAGQDYETLIRDRICRPLKMESTVIALTPEMQPRLAVGHAPADQRTGYIGLKSLPGAGAILSTANDMLKFASARLGLTPFPRPAVFKRAVGGHNGGTFGFNSLLEFDIEQHRAIVVLSNCRHDQILEHLWRLMADRSPVPTNVVRATGDNWDRFGGQYYAHGQRLRIVHRVGTRLTLQEWGQPGCELFPVSETNFYNRLFDCRATFVGRDEAGHATDLIIGDFAHPSWRGTRVPGEILLPSGATLTDAQCVPRAGSDIQGVWTATVRPWYWPFHSVRVKVRIAEPSAGSFWSELESADIDAHHLPLAIIYRPPQVEVIPLVGEGGFEGTLNGDRTKVTGRWTQAGQSLRATFRRTAEKTERPPRPVTAMRW